MEKMHLDPEEDKTILLEGLGGHPVKKGKLPNSQVTSLQNMERVLKETYGPAIKADLNRQIYGQASGFTIHKEATAPEFWSSYQAATPAEADQALDALMAALMADPPEGMATQQYTVTLSAPEVDWIGEEPETVYAKVTVPPGLNYAAADALLKNGLKELESWGADTTRISWDISW